MAWTTEHDVSRTDKLANLLKPFLPIHTDEDRAIYLARAMEWVFDHPFPPQKHFVSELMFRLQPEFHAALPNWLKCERMGDSGRHLLFCVTDERLGEKSPKIFVHAYSTGSAMGPDITLRGWFYDTATNDRLFRLLVERVAA